MPKTVGILGGMGPHASAHFLHLFHQELNKRGVYDDHQFPRIIYLGLPLSNWGVAGASDKESVSRQLSAAMDWLVGAGADVIAIPCNSVHEFHAEISASFRARVLNIVTETLVRSFGMVGVLCSQQTRECGLYERPSCLYVSEQSKVDEAIQAVIDGQRPYIGHLIDQLIEIGADTVVLGCTELSLCSYDYGSIVVDSSAILASALADSL